MSQSTVSYLWREPSAAKSFTRAVSLHSHTNHSRETLDFIAALSTQWRFIEPVMRLLESRCYVHSGISPDYTRSFWTPPLNPRMALDLETTQIEHVLNLSSLVSLTDHDDINAPLLLRTIPSARHTPVSVEWTVPYCAPQAGFNTFHLGIHNLPGALALPWMARLAAFTALPVVERPTGLLQEILADLAAIPSVLIVFNHPLWDLYRIGAARHLVLVNDFLARHGQFCHALELNGLRHWSENREAADLAAKWNQLTISGGDRHGLEPNANLNLTHASTFSEFVHEVRVLRRSDVLFMPQYAQPWKHRILQSTLDAIRNHTHFPEGSRTWDQRVFHPDANGVLQPLSHLWPAGNAPRYLSAVLVVVRLMGQAPISGGLRMAWNDTSAMRATLARLDA